MRSRRPPPSPAVADPTSSLWRDQASTGANEFPSEQPGFAADQACPLAVRPVHDTAEELNASTAGLPELLSAAEVQAVFGRSSRTIRRWMRRNYLTPVRVGRSLFFRPDDIRRVISDELQDKILAGVRHKGQPTDK